MEPSPLFTLQRAHACITTFTVFDDQVLSISFSISMGHSEVKLNTQCEALLTALPVTDMAEGVRMS